jgi:hypothetical protein
MLRASAQMRVLTASQHAAALTGGSARGGRCARLPATYGKAGPQQCGLPAQRSEADQRCRGASPHTTCLLLPIKPHAGCACCCPSHHTMFQNSNQLAFLYVFKTFNNFYQPNLTVKLSGHDMLSVVSRSGGGYRPPLPRHPPLPCR